MESVQMCNNRSVDNGSRVHVDIGIVFSCEGKWNNEICKKMGGTENIVLREVSLTQKNKYACSLLIHKHF